LSVDVKFQPQRGRSALVVDRPRLGIGVTKRTDIFLARRRRKISCRKLPRRRR